MQQEQLKILQEFDWVCKKLNLTYCLAYGTCLGAKRHNGFIPWDDDVDVYMRLEDLETLQNHGDLFRSPFFLQHHKSDPQYGLMITRLRNSATTLVESTETDRDMNHGIYIDIYPLFHTPKEGIGAKFLVAISRLYRLMLYGKPPKHHGKWMNLGSIVLLNMIPKIMRSGIMRICFYIMKSYKKTGYYSSLYGEYFRYPEEIFFPVRYALFENMFFPVPAKQEQYLEMVYDSWYGSYMTLPPVEARKPHHDYVCLDFEKPYTEYKGIYYCKEE